ncbi:polysaccharide biosynthesis/export family protein [uncultured Alistipes sp.]|jgi:hypothetical protein|uniref:polysaccharide biosynthesis/export family protein n=1 Tax=uncultured Alistipes sp. TaxID=538949 RepID=UPI0025E6EA3F|nr:polysaccharide biosynthesis/export family protein [uncultured Alistipes sp.]
MRKLALLFALAILLSSCATRRNIAYLQDAQPNMMVLTDKGEFITLRPGDVLYIYVSSKDPELAMLFNLPRIQSGLDDSESAGGRRSGVLGYTVDSDGCIDFPVLGKLHIAGMKREEVGAFVKETLISQNLIKDPIVTITFSNLTFSAMGEVSRPGQYGINKDKMTILEALSMAGDLTIHGSRDKVFVIRQNEGNRITYQLDLRSTLIYNSPAFYIQQNDVIYVEPNKVKSGQSSVNANNVRSVSLWVSIASFLTTIGVLIFK